MREIIETQNALKVGASVTLVELEEALKHQIKIKPGKVLRVRYYMIIFSAIRDTFNKQITQNIQTG